MIELNELNRFYLKSPKQIVDVKDEQKIELYTILDSVSKKFATATGFNKLLEELEGETKSIAAWCYENVNQKEPEEITEDWWNFYVGFVYEFIMSSMKQFKDDKTIHNLKTIRIFLDTLKQYILDNEEKIEELLLKEKN